MCKIIDAFYGLVTLAGLFASGCSRPTEACFTYSPPSGIVSGTSVTFDASCTRHGGYSYRWNFGDGSGDTLLLGQSSMAHVFKQAGTFIVTLEAGRKDNLAMSKDNKQAYLPPHHS